MNWLRRPDVRYSLILAAVAVVLWAPRLRGSIDLRFDAGVYYILGTSIAEGKGYRLLNEPGEISALQYPPLLPAVVAVEQKLLGTSDPAVVGQALRLTYFALFVVYSLGVYRLASRFLSPGYGFVVALICTLSCDMLYLSDLLQAELPFVTMTVLFALAARVGRDDGTERDSPARFVLAALLGIATFLIRSAGIGLLAAWVGESVFRRQWKRAALQCVVAAIPFVAWQAWCSHVRHSAEYANPTYAYQRLPYQFYNVSYAENLLLVDSFKPELGRIGPVKMARRVAKNAIAMPPSIGESMAAAQAVGGWMIHWINEKAGRTPQNSLIPWRILNVGSWGFGIITLTGAVVLAVRRRWFVPLYVAATLGLICLTPWPDQYLRYLASAAPFLAICLITSLSGARECFAKRPEGFARRVGTGAAVALAGLVPVMGAVGIAWIYGGYRAPLVPGEPKLFYVAEDWAGWSEALRWVDAKAGDNDVIATANPHLLNLYTGRKSVMPPMEVDTAKALRYLDSVPVRYVIVGDFRFLNVDLRYAGPAVYKNPLAWNLVFTSLDTKTKIFERTSVPTEIATQRPTTAATTKPATQPQRSTMMKGVNNVRPLAATD